MTFYFLDLFFFCKFQFIVDGAEHQSNDENWKKEEELTEGAFQKPRRIQTEEEI